MEANHSLITGSIGSVTFAVFFPFQEKKGKDNNVSFALTRTNDLLQGRSEPSAIGAANSFFF